MAGVRYVGASRVYAKGAKPAVDMLDLDIKDGEFMVLVGPSGSGKTTALRMLAGLEPLDGGRIEIAGRDVSDVQPKDRDIAMVFQNYALYPSKTGGFARRPASSTWTTPCSTASRRRCPAASGSASPWGGPSSGSRRSS